MSKQDPQTYYARKGEAMNRCENDDCTCEEHNYPTVSTFLPRVSFTSAKDAETLFNALNLAFSLSSGTDKDTADLLVAVHAEWKRLVAQESGRDLDKCPVCKCRPIEQDAYPLLCSHCRSEFSD